MANLIDHTYFIGALSIPNTSQASVQGLLAILITKNQDKLLTDLLGYKMAKDFIAGLTVTSPATPDAKWTALKDGAEYTDCNGRLLKWTGLVDSTAKQSMIANFCYYWYHRTQASITAGVGQVVTKAENAERVSPAGVMSTAWNEMAKYVWQLVRFLEAKKEDYPDFERRCISIDYFTTINAFNL